MGNKLMKHVDSGPDGMVLFYCQEIYEPAESMKNENEIHVSIFYAKHCKNVLNFFFQLS